MWATSVIFKKLSRVHNHPLGKFSPNRVTLIYHYQIVTGPLAHLFYTNIDRLAGATR
jgi:hypothetical protein